MEERKKKLYSLTAEYKKLSHKDKIYLRPNIPIKSLNWILEHSDIISDFNDILLSVDFSRYNRRNSDLIVSCDGIFGRNTNNDLFKFKFGSSPDFYDENDFLESIGLAITDFFNFKIIPVRKKYKLLTFMYDCVKTYKIVTKEETEFQRVGTLRKLYQSDEFLSSVTEWYNNLTEAVNGIYIRPIPFAELNSAFVKFLMESQTVFSDVLLALAGEDFMCCTLDAIIFKKLKGSESRPHGKYYTNLENYGDGNKEFLKIRRKDILDIDSIHAIPRTIIINDRFRVNVNNIGTDDELDKFVECLRKLYDIDTKYASSTETTDAEKPPYLMEFDKLKGESSSLKFREGLMDEFRDDFRDVYRMFMYPNIDVMFLNLAISSYAKGVDPFDVVLLYDVSLPGKKADRFLFTSTALYTEQLSLYKDSAKTGASYLWKDIDSLWIENQGILINREFMLRTHLPTQIKQNLVGVMQWLIDLA
jgi:hypothetical protein